MAGTVTRAVDAAGGQFEFGAGADLTFGYLTVLADAWNSCPGQPLYDAAANLDQVATLPGACVGDEDFHLFMDAFGRSCP